MQINLSNPFLIQSPYLYCQAAGSDGSDISTPGVHLRWELLKQLGENHIPKGDLQGSSSNPYNRSDDYVRLYRTDFEDRYYIPINFTSMGATEDVPLNAAFELMPDWKGVVYRYHIFGRTVRIQFRFLDTEQFRNYLLQHGPAIEYYFTDLFRDYTGIIEIEVEGQLLFAYDFVFDIYHYASGSVLQPVPSACYETVSLSDTGDPSSVQVVKRSYVKQSVLVRHEEDEGTYPEHKFTTAENIKYIRIQHSEGFRPLQLKLYTYFDYFKQTQNHDEWEPVNEETFALSLDDDTVYSRIETEDVGYSDDRPQFYINWPQYEPSRSMEGSNYADRWIPVVPDGNPGMKETLEQFLSLGDSDPKAIVNLQQDNDSKSPNSITVSLLDMLKMIAQDYHAARMLGLGKVDRDTDSNPNKQYIYAVLYTTEVDLPGAYSTTDHLYFTLPTGRGNHRLPLAPEHLELTYGLTVSSIDSTSTIASDSDGYSLREPVRFVNINKQDIGLPQNVLSYIPADDPFDITQLTQTAAFSIKYRKAETEWDIPDLVHDDFYSLRDGFLENAFIPNGKENPLYTHFETNEGVHDYALISINWFSRSSDFSSARSTETYFQRTNNLLPPVNLSVQYIQEEDPLILTSQSEQDQLAELESNYPGVDVNKTRVLFNWDEIHSNAYQFADTAEFFFRSEPIKKVEGKVLAVFPLSPSESEVHVGSFSITSTNPVTTVSPSITVGEEYLFIGVPFNTVDGQFIIKGIAQGLNGLVFTVENSLTNQAFQPGANEPFSVVPSYVAPKAGDVFFILENAQELNRWQRLDRTVALISWGDNIETVYEADGSSHDEHVGGIVDEATIIEILGSNGGYTIIFDNAELDAHPESDVSWVRGTVRVPIEGSLQVRKLPVLAIQQTHKIILTVFDSEYNNPSSPRIVTDKGLRVNFHPGYRVYLSPEGSFSRSNILPQGTANTKKTYLAVRSADTATNLASLLTPQGVIIARNIQKPLAPVAIVSPLYATRPDSYGKSNYTMDIQLNDEDRVPYGIVTYRGTDMGILHALYKPSTIEEIKEALAALPPDDPYTANRWQGLAEVVTDPSDDNAFELFSDFRFPLPDNNETQYIEPGSDPSDPSYPFPLSGGQTITNRKAVIRKVIEDTFIALTETPVVLEFLKTGLQTSADKPVTRSLVGKLLDPSDLGFNPYPMCVKLPGVPLKTRFTDYSLEGGARNLYFYFAREVAVTTKLSERTAITGPVLLVDASPAEAPAIIKVVTQEANVLDDRPGVLIDVAPYIDAEGIAKLAMYRTMELTASVSTQNMQAVGLFDPGTTLEDRFVDMDFPPFGQPIYYRAVALRKIKNEHGEEELIPSKPSGPAIVSIIDVVNPPAPEMTHEIESIEIGIITGEVVALNNVSFSWPQTVFNGQYYLYRMNSKGNWELLWKVASNNSTINYPENGDFGTFPATAYLPKKDDDGNTIYYRFKVVAENASGLFSIEEKEIVI